MEQAMADNDVRDTRAKAEEILSRASSDSEFADRLRSDSTGVLQDFGLLDALQAEQPMIAADHGCEFTCVDFTCIFSKTACPETCLPFGTHVMTLPEVPTE
jgi:hypothetical protein